MSDGEVTDRLADALREVQMVVTPDKVVTIYCEDKQNELPGKKYIFVIKFPLDFFRQLFEGGHSGLGISGSEGP